MAEIKSTATAASKKTAQPQKGGNLIATLAPIACIVLGYVIWRFVLGNAANFTNPDLMVDSGLLTKDQKVHLQKCMKVVSLCLF